MLLLDALFAAILFKFFGESALWILGITCAVAFLRMYGRLSFVIRVLHDSFAYQLTKPQEKKDDKDDEEKWYF